MQDFISLKRSVGYKYNSEPGILKRFDNYLAVHYPETDILSKEAVVGWCCKTMHETAANHCSRASVIRQFSKYLDSIGIKCNPRFYSSPKEGLSVTLSEGTV